MARGSRTGAGKTEPACICTSFVTYVKFCGQKLYRKRVEADSLLAIKEFTLTFQFEFCYGKKMYLIFYLLFFYIY